ncbi:DUF2894 domain-containing protein [Acidovorax sp.]|uniref:DUF2894 domain-containing protein n=1 Tax=Acidovorax sp. TaxID=1872122 RepID=UPI00261A16AC|nr:DUF2894 domain-containing protein [Acidovorax sp.]
MSELLTEPTLESLRAEGAHRHDPARFHYLEVLAQRLPGQPAAVQKVLAGRLLAAVVAYAEQARQAPIATKAPSSAPGKTGAATVASPLAQLNRDLSARREVDAEAARTGDGASLSDMKSVRQFSEVWSKISAEQQVVQALHRGPENAGPLNAHKLMLRTLSLMRTLSPDYLRRFMSQMDSLLWLEQAGSRAPSPAARPARKGRAKP